MFIQNLNWRDHVFLSRLYDVYPAMDPKEQGFTGSRQALQQLAASVVTIVFALVGGGLTGLIMKFIGRWQHLDSAYHKGMTVMKLALQVGKITSGAANIEASMPMEVYFDDNLFFEVHDEEDPMDGQDNFLEQTVVVKDQGGNVQKYRRYSQTSISYMSNSSAAENKNS